MNQTPIKWYDKLLAPVIEFLIVVVAIVVLFLLTDTKKDTKK